MIQLLGDAALHEIIANSNKTNTNERCLSANKSLSFVILWLCRRWMSFELKNTIWRTCFVRYCRVCSAAHTLQSTRTWIDIFETAWRSDPAEDKSVICHSYIHLCLYTVLQYFTLHSGLPRVPWTTQIIFNTLSEAGVEQHKSWRLELHLLLQCTHDLKEYFT